MIGNEISEDKATSLQVLEEFVVNNDELLELEERIGRFNIFDALRVERVEIRHSNFLAWLLDPAESHGQGSLFLKAILMDLLSQTPPDMRPLSPVELDGEELRGMEIRREWRHIDLIIICREPAFVIAIENKIDSSEHGPQLDRYHKIVMKQFSDVEKKLFIYLTVDGDEPSREEWVPYTYADVQQVLTRVRRLHKTSIGEDVLVFLDHYLRLIGSKFMDDPMIDQLCEKIYKNHRQAIDLIFERVVSPSAGIVSTLEQQLDEDKRWRTINRTSKEIAFIPSSWDGLLPAIGKRKNFDPTTWIVLRFEIQRKGCYAGVLVWPTTDASLRSRVIERLIADEQEFGLSTFFKNKQNISERWTKLGRKRIASWKEDDGPDEEKVMKAVLKQLEEWQQSLAGIPNVLRPIIKQWKHDKAETE